MCGDRCVAITGVITVIIAITSIPLLTIIIQEQIKKRVVLEEGSLLYTIWKSPSQYLPIYMQFYVFDVRNPQQVLQGDKPYLVEKGPYTYREVRRKHIISQNDNGTVTYRENISYVFVPGMSVGLENDTFTTANLIIAALVNAVRFESDEIKEGISLLLELFREHMFVELTVHDIIWGYRDQLLTVGSLLFPQWFTTRLVGALTGRNNTDNGLFTIFTGKNNVSQLGQVNKYNGKRHLSYWSTSYANMINGTDGSVTHPGVSKSVPLFVFSPDTCRSVHGVYNSTDDSQYGFPVYRFSAPPSLLANASVNPDNIGFCTPQDHCMGSGVMNISQCKIVDFFHIPLVLSLPHFLMADQKFREAVSNLHPDERYHNTVTDLEPMTGILMYAAKRLQINVYIKPYQDISVMRNIKEVVLPVLWLNESARIDKSHLNTLRQQLFLPLKIAHIVQYVAIAAGLLLVAVAVCWMVYRNVIGCKQSEEMSELPSEREPLLSSHDNTSSGSNDS